MTYSIVSLEDVTFLMERQRETCVSLYMPTLQKGSETQQNQIRYKNLLRRSEEALVKQGMKAGEARSFLSPATKLIHDMPFWQNQSEGLAVFVSENFFRYYRLPRHCEELVMVGDRFHLKPLIPFFGEDITFYVLAISQNTIRLIQCSRHTAEDVTPEKLPNNLTDALNLDSVEKRLQLHTGSEDTKANILQYFKLVDKALHDLLQNSRAFLIFAGVDYLFPLFKEANTYPFLMDRPVTGNPDEVTDDDLRKWALPIIDDYVTEKTEEAFALFRRNAGTGLSSCDVAVIVRAARDGRVSSLFVPTEHHQWGAFDAETGDVTVHDDIIAGSEDLLDRAALQTLTTGGTVYTVNIKDLPEGTKIAACFRY